MSSRGGKYVPRVLIYICTSVASVVVTLKKWLIKVVFFSFLSRHNLIVLEANSCLFKREHRIALLYIYFFFLPTEVSLLQINFESFFLLVQINFEFLFCEFKLILVQNYFEIFLSSKLI